jgi:hypothetical protein
MRRRKRRRDCVMSVLVEFGENYFKPGTPTPLFETQFDSTGN